MSDDDWMRGVDDWIRTFTRSWSRYAHDRATLDYLLTSDIRFARRLMREGHLSVADFGEFVSAVVGAYAARLLELQDQDEWIRQAWQEHRYIWSDYRVMTALVAEGFAPADVSAAFDSMVNAGLELDQPDDGYILTAGEVAVLRDQLSDGRR